MTHSRGKIKEVPVTCRYERKVVVCNKYYSRGISSNMFGTFEIQPSHLQTSKQSRKKVLSAVQNCSDALDILWQWLMLKDQVVVVVVVVVVFSSDNNNLSPAQPSKK